MIFLEIMSYKSPKFGSKHKKNPYTPIPRHNLPFLHWIQIDKKKTLTQTGIIAKSSYCSPNGEQ